jgi:hypothetical protein
MASTVLYEYYCLSVCLLFASGMKRVEEHAEEAVGKSDLGWWYLCHKTSKNCT